MKKIKISIQQPEYFPWLGYFDKIAQVDKLVILDNVQFKKRYFENRNKIRTSQGWMWLTTPVKTKGRYTQNINTVEIDNSMPWQKKAISAITHNYKNTPYWEDLGGELIAIISKPRRFLIDLNMEIIVLLMRKLNMMREWCMASSLNTGQTGSDLILEICKKMKATEYFSGISGKNYLKEGDFINSEIKLSYQKFNHPVYKQMHGSFESGLSTVDLYFNHGPESMNIIKHKTLQGDRCI